MADPAHRYGKDTEQLELSSSGLSAEIYQSFIELSTLWEFFSWSITVLMHTYVNATPSHLLGNPKRRRLLAERLGSTVQRESAWTFLPCQPQLLWSTNQAFVGWFWPRSAVKWKI